MEIPQPVTVTPVQSMRDKCERIYNDLQGSGMGPVELMMTAYAAGRDEGSDEAFDSVLGWFGHKLPPKGEQVTK